MRWLLLLVVAGCPEDGHFQQTYDAEVPPTPGIAVHGRVVDFESCPVPPGCQPLADMIVSVDGTGQESGPTGAEGAFLIEGAPDGVAFGLTVRSASAGAFAVTRSANLVPASSTDVFDVLLYVLPHGEGTLLGAIQGESGVDLEETGGYVGQVVARIDPDVEGDRLCPDIDEGLCAVPDAQVSIAPVGYGTVTYVNGLPAFVPEGQTVLLPLATATNVSGLFAVIPSAPTIAGVDLALSHASLTFMKLTASIEPRVVTLGIHRDE